MCNCHYVCYHILPRCHRMSRTESHCGWQSIVSAMFSCRWTQVGNHWRESHPWPWPANIKQGQLTCSHYKKQTSE